MVIEFSVAKELDVSWEGLPLSAQQTFGLLRRCARSGHSRAFSRACRASLNGCRIALVTLLEEDLRPGIVAEALMAPGQTGPFK
jgi:hypothetical protein